MRERVTHTGQGWRGKAIEQADGWLFVEWQGARLPGPLSNVEAKKSKCLALGVVGVEAASVPMLWGLYPPGSPCLATREES